MRQAGLSLSLSLSPSQAAAANCQQQLEFTRDIYSTAPGGDDPSGPTGGVVREGVPDLGPEAPRAPMGAAQRENFEHLRRLGAFF